jgi:hypothetical protein
VKGETLRRVLTDPLFARAGQDCFVLHLEPVAAAGKIDAIVLEAPQTDIQHFRSGKDRVAKRS